jgi:hypothetical protein
LSVEVESTKGTVFAKIHTEVVALRVPCLSVEHVEIAFEIEVTEAVLDVFVAEVSIV